jgi:hypothetical protein
MFPRFDAINHGGKHEGGQAVAAAGFHTLDKNVGGGRRRLFNTVSRQD